MSEGKWYGNTDNTTSPACYYYDYYNGKKEHKEELGKVAEKIEEQRIVEAAQPKKEPENIHQMMYERASKYWGTWKEEIQSPGGSENFQSGPGGWNSGNGMAQFK